MKSKIIILFILFTFSFTLFVDGKEKKINEDNTSSIVSSFRFLKDLNNLSINVPTVVEVPFTNDFVERFDFAVFDKTTNTFESYYFKKEKLINEIPLSVNTFPVYSDALIW